MGKHIDSKLFVKVKSIYTASATSENEKELINTTALLRRKTMVVDYEKVNAKIQEGTGIYGIVAAGTHAEPAPKTRCCIIF